MSKIDRVWHTRVRNEVWCEREHKVYKSSASLKGSEAIMDEYPRHESGSIGGNMYGKEKLNLRSHNYKSKLVGHGNAIKVHVGWAMGVSSHKQESASSLDYRPLNLEKSHLV